MVNGTDVGIDVAASPERSMSRVASKLGADQWSMPGGAIDRFSVRALACDPRCGRRATIRVASRAVEIIDSIGLGVAEIIQFSVLIVEQIVAQL
jgi:hypothetical protein